MTQYSNSVTEEAGLGDLGAGDMVLHLAEALGIDDTFVLDSIFTLLDTIGINSTLDNLLKAQINAADGVALNDVFSFFIDVLATDTLGLQDIPAIYKNNVVAIADAMVVVGLAESRLTGLNLLSAIIGIYETLDKGLASSVLDTIGITDDVIDIFALAGLSSEMIGLQDVLSYNIGMFLSISEALGLQSAQTLAQTLQTSIDDGMSFAVTLLGPGSAVYTGWVMNSENMAVTTYADYNFTDMAKINGLYYGVKSDGLFLLDGNTDDGDFVEAIIRSAKMDLGTSNLKSMTECYMGFDGDGNPVIKMITDEAEETWYYIEESRTDLHTATIPLAKGQIGRYWQFEIVTQDSTKLELDTIELFPIVFKRKR